MIIALIVASCVAVLGWAAAPFALIDNTVAASIIAGVFSTVNVLLNAFIIREARANRREIKGARATAHEAHKELLDVKDKVRGERRRNPNKPKPGGKRRGTDA